MTLITENLSLYAGDSLDLTMSVTNLDGTVKDLTSADVSWGIFNENTGELLVQKSTVSGIIITSVPSGVCVISVLPEDTEDIRPATWYRHEGEVIDAQGNVSTVLVGNFTIMESII